MSTPDPRRPITLVALLATALVTGAIAGLATAVFIWLYEKGMHLLWYDLPDELGVDAFGSWWLFAVPVVGGVLVGLGHLILGNYPIPIEEAIEKWRTGGRLEPITAPKSAVNSLIALVAGGPVGFEAALTGLIGGSAAWVGDRVGSVGHLVRQAWGAERIDSVPDAVRKLPLALAAIAGLVAYKAAPFGGMDLGFRFSPNQDHMTTREALIAFAFAAAVTVPVAWVISLVARTETMTLYKRNPILVAVAGGVIFAAMAIPSDMILFSGQQAIQLLPQAGTGELIWVAAMKWVVMGVVFAAGWRGGPIFPTFTSVAALAVLVDSPLGVPSHVVMIAGIVAVSLVFLKGKIVVAFVLSLYVVPLSYSGLIIVGCLGAAVALAVAESTKVIPASAAEPEPSGT